MVIVVAVRDQHAMIQNRGSMAIPATWEWALSAKSYKVVDGVQYYNDTTKQKYGDQHTARTRRCDIIPQTH